MPDYTDELNDLEHVFTQTSKELNRDCGFQLLLLVQAMKDFIELHDAKILSESKLNKLKAKLSMEDSYEEDDFCSDCPC